MLKLLIGVGIMVSVDVVSRPARAECKEVFIAPQILQSLRYLSKNLTEITPQLAAALETIWENDAIQIEVLRKRFGRDFSRKDQNNFGARERAEEPAKKPRRLTPRLRGGN